MIEISYTANPEALEQRLDKLMEALVDAEVPDPCISADFSTGKVTLSIGDVDSWSAQNSVSRSPR